MITAVGRGGDERVTRAVYNPRAVIQAFHVYKQYDRESSALSDITLHIKKASSRS